MARRATTGPLPTSRFSGPYQSSQIPAFCRTFTGTTYDLPYFSGKHAGIYRPNDRPKRSKNRHNAGSPSNQALP
jgi:hypothetical protein